MYIKKAEIFKAPTHHDSKYFLSSFPGTSENIQLRKILKLKSFIWIILILSEKLSSENIGFLRA